MCHHNIKISFNLLASPVSFRAFLSESTFDQTVHQLCRQHDALYRVQNLDLLNQPTVGNASFDPANNKIWFQKRTEELNYYRMKLSLTAIFLTSKLWRVAEQTIIWRRSPVQVTFGSAAWIRSMVGKWVLPDTKES